MALDHESLQYLLILTSTTILQLGKHHYPTPSSVYFAFIKSFDEPTIRQALLSNAFHCVLCVVFINSFEPKHGKHHYPMPSKVFFVFVNTFDEPTALSSKPKAQLSLVSGNNQWPARQRIQNQIPRHKPNLFNPGGCSQFILDTRGRVFNEKGANIFSHDLDVIKPPDPPTLVADDLIRH